MQIIIEITNQVDEALLLQALGRVVCRIEVRNQHPGKSVEQFIQNGPLPRCCVCVDHFFEVGEGPDIAGVLLDLSLSFVGMNQRTTPKLVFQQFICDPLLRGDRGNDVREYPAFK